MVIDVEQDIDVANIGLEHDAPPIAIQTHGLEVLVACAVDVLVVDARIGGVSLEQYGPLQHLGMN